MANMGYDGQSDHHLPAMTPGAVSERGPNTPWNNDDYEFPHSAGPVSILLDYISLKFMSRNDMKIMSFLVAG